jgi:2-methylcitrate dehydratase PrpD
LGATADLVEFIVDTNYNDFSPNTINSAKMCLLDWFGAALSGLEEKEAKILLKTIEEVGGKEEAILIGTKLKSTCLNAALFNGYIGHIQKLDDASPYGSLVHTQSPMLPATLALAERDGLSGKKLITSIIVGFEVEVRICMGINPSHYHERFFHSTGTCGTFGAVAAAGKLLDLNEEQMMNAFGIAATQAAGLLAALPTMARSLSPGKGALNGLLAALLAKKGFTGPSDILEREGGYFQAVSNKIHLEKIVANLGDKYAIDDERFVRYGSDGAIHSAIDALLDIMQKHEITHEDIESIEAKVFPVAYEVTGTLYEPKTGSHARFSLPYGLAAAALDGEVGPKQFTDERVKDPKIIKFAKKVTASIDPEFAKLGYSSGGSIFQGSKVKVRTTKGDEYDCRVDSHKGTPANPLTEDELFSKLKWLAVPVIGKDNVEKLIDEVKKLDQLSSIDSIMSLLSS